MFYNLYKNWTKKQLKDKKFNFLFDEALKNEFVCLDCETSGLNPKKDEILSIGAVIIKDNKILMRKTFNIFIKPSKDINPESIKIHHIRLVDLENGLNSKEAIFELLEFIGSRIIVGYYIKFDMAIISKYTKEFIGIKLHTDHIRKGRSLSGLFAFGFCLCRSRQTGQERYMGSIVWC